MTDKQEHTMLFVRLAADEWASQGDCERFARLALEQHTADIVHVDEHGGWFETYVQTLAGVRRIATANDCAVYSPEQRALQVEYLSEYRVIGHIESASLVEKAGVS